MLKQMSSDNRKQIQSLWISYMLNQNPLIGWGQSQTRASCQLRQKPNNVVYVQAFLNTYSPVSTHGIQIRRAGITVIDSDHCKLLHSLCDWDVKGRGQGGSFPPSPLFPVSNFQAAPVTSSLDFHSFLLSLFGFFSYLF